MMKQIFKQQVLSANKGKLKIKKPKKWLYPMAAERSYIKELLKINEEFWKSVKINLIPTIPMLVADAQSTRGDSHKHDSSWIDQLKQIVEKTYFDFQKIIREPTIKAITKEQAEKISLMNKIQFVKVIQSAVSINPITAENWLEPQMKAFQSQNTDLITKLSREQRDRVENTLYTNLRAGKGVKEITKQLQKDKEFGKNRSKLIARDQTNKFNGQLAQLRQTELGIETYIWTTSRDERVRASHRALDGKVIKWTNPPPEGHAGNPIRCRCIAQPIINDAMFE